MMVMREAATLRQRAIFRFMNLAPELRNRIYEYALVQNRFEDQTANTALLRVCKQVQQEATGIFWSQTTFCVKLSSLDQSPNANGIVISGDLALVWQDSNQHLDIFTSIWPSAVLRTSTIEVIVERGSHTVANHIIYSLAGALRHSELRTQKLQIKVTPHPRSGLSEVRMAYPLLKMPAHLSISYDSADRQAARQVRAKYLEGNKVRLQRPALITFDAAVQMHHLRPKLETYLAKLARSDVEVKEISVRTIARHAERHLKSCYPADLFSDRVLVASVSTLARWTEMCEAAVSSGPPVPSGLPRLYSRTFCAEQEVWNMLKAEMR